MAIEILGVGARNQMWAARAHQFKLKMSVNKHAGSLQQPLEHSLLKNGSEKNVKAVRFGAAIANIRNAWY